MNKRFAFLLIGGLVIPQTFWRERSEILLKILRQHRTLFYSHVAIVSVFSFHVWRVGDLLKVVFLPTVIS